MRYSILALLSLTIAGSQAMPTSPSPVLRIPPGQRDGSYIVHNWDTAQELHERLPDVLAHELEAYTAKRAAAIAAAAISPNVDATSTPFKRDDYIACGCIDLNHRDCDDATHGVEFFADRDQRVHPGTCFYQFARSVVAFVCVPRGDLNLQVTGANMRGKWRDITNHCGWYKAGSTGWKPHHVAGYMAASHKDYFGDAWKSPRTSC
ncbi:uncharacterized protein PG986_010160 [Apiospora aurea]|uniref:Ecp2 effector protein domain-containing protein n=1 Tax=Apiospora aurea TaxID=335848 RepID=A0ABR1QA46_9PEZI